MSRKFDAVNISKPASTAFNKERRAGKLLQSQVLHQRHALAKHLQKVIEHLNQVANLMATDVDTLKTEGDIAGYARRVTEIVHSNSWRHQGK